MGSVLNSRLQNAIQHVLTSNAESSTLRYNQPSNGLMLDTADKNVNSISKPLPTSRTSARWLAHAKKTLLISDHVKTPSMHDTQTEQAANALATAFKTATGSRHLEIWQPSSTAAWRRDRNLHLAAFPQREPTLQRLKFWGRSALSNFYRPRDAVKNVNDLIASHTLRWNAGRPEEWQSQRFSRKNGIFT